MQVFPGTSAAELFLHTGEQYLSERGENDLERLRQVAADHAHLGVKAPVQHLQEVVTRPGWFLDVEGTGFRARMRVALAANREHRG